MRHKAPDDESTALVSRASKDEARQSAPRKRGCPKYLPWKERARSPVLEQARKEEFLREEIRGATQTRQ